MWKLNLINLLILIFTGIASAQDSEDFTWVSGWYEPGYPVQTEYKHALALRHKVLVYEKADSNAKVIGELPIGRYINVLVIKSNWLRIYLGNESKYKHGYVLSSQIASHSFYHDDSTSVVFGSPNHYIDSALIIYKRSTKQYEVLDSFKVKKLSWCYDVTEINDCPMAGIEKLYKIDFYCKSCPEAKSFVTKTKSGFKLIDTLNTETVFVNDSVSYEEYIYLPIKFGNGVIKLVQNGDVENMLDRYLGELNVFIPPKSLNLPLKNLVVKKRHYSYYKGDKVIKEKDVIRYYQWNGLKLINLKQ